ncbi:unnamed protein product [Blepharisma stoltei]|uniref:Signal recognition particle 9 kDa protein n=1 Tax=Blepharisma stoltei TaxID=1481888 RepID=A0AAU9J0W0_9CILI|nr:unnamed protein product [Blepharisma stoltei]
MVKFRDWDDFCVKAWELASTDGGSARWSIKLSPSKGVLKVKVTNSSKTYIYQLQDVEAEFNKVKQFSLSMSRILTRFEERGKAKKKPRTRA